MSARAMTGTYGGYDCCEEFPEYAVTRTDATGTVTYRTCRQHRDACAATSSRWVAGWGAVQTLEIRQLERVTRFYYASADALGVLCVDSVNEHMDEQEVAGLADSYPGTIYFEVAGVTQ